MGRPSVKNFSHNEIVEATPGTDTDIYASGDAIGTNMTIPGLVHGDYGGAMLHTLEVLDMSAQSEPVKVFLFNTNFATQTDNAAATLASSDMLNLVSMITVDSTDYVTLSTGTVPTVAYKTDLGIPLQASGDQNLYGLVLCQGTPTYTSTDAIRLKFGVSRDD